MDTTHEVGAKISNTNSFALTVTRETTMQGGARGNYFVGGDQFNTIKLGGGTSVAVGGNGGNQFHSGTGNDTLIGGKGVDTAVFTGNRANFSITNSGNTLSVRDTTNALGTDTLSRVERLVFNDKKLAFDMDGSAGNTTKMIVAAFGKTALTPELVNEGLKVFDAGMSMKDVADIVVGLPSFISLAGSSSNTDFVRLVYKNVVGTSPSAAELNLYVGILDQGTSQADLLVLAANADINAVNINLVGLQQTGVEFV